MFSYDYSNYVKGIKDLPLLAAETRLLTPLAKALEALAIWLLTELPAWATVLSSPETTELAALPTTLVADLEVN